MLNILLIDDHPDYLDLIGDFLKKDLAANVVTASSAAQAIALFTDGRRFDVVICDYQMPNGTGLDVFERMKQSKIETPFILCTNMDIASLPKFIGPGFLGIIQKTEAHRVCEHLLTLTSQDKSKKE